MPDESVNNQAASEASSQEQAGAEVASTSPEGAAAAQQAQDQAAAQKEYMFGGNKYNDPDKLYEAARKWESDITRKNQERAAKDKEVATQMGQMKVVIDAIRSDD